LKKVWSNYETWLQRIGKKIKKRKRIT